MHSVIAICDIKLQILLQHGVSQGRILGQVNLKRDTVLSDVHLLIEHGFKAWLPMPTKERALAISGLMLCCNANQSAEPSSHALLANAATI